MTHVQRYPFAPKAVWWKRYTDKSTLGKRKIYVATDEIGFEIANLRSFAKTSLREGTAATNADVDYEKIADLVNIKQLKAGLYSDKWTLLYDWDELIVEGLITVQNQKLVAVSKNMRGILKISDEITELAYTGGSGGGAFYQCKLSGVIISNNITEIGAYMFFDSPLLSFVMLGSGVQTIREQAFQACTSITSIFIPANVTSITSTFNGSGIFAGNTKITIYCERSSAPSGWGAYWKYYDTTQTSLPVKYGYTEEQYNLETGTKDQVYSPTKAIKLFNKFYIFNFDTNELEENELADEGLEIINAIPSEVMTIERNSYIRQYAFDCTKETDQQDSSYQPISGLLTGSSYITIKTHNFANTKDEPRHEDILQYQGKFWMIEDTSKTYIYTPREKAVLHISLKALK